MANLGNFGNLTDSAKRLTERVAIIERQSVDRDKHTNILIQLLYTRLMAAEDRINDVEAYFRKQVENLEQDMERLKRPEGQLLEENNVPTQDITKISAIAAAAAVIKAEGDE